MRITVVVRLAENLGLLQFKVFRMRCQSIVEPVNILRRNIDIYLDGIIARTVGIIVQDHSDIRVNLAVSVYIGMSVKFGVVSPERGVELVTKFDKSLVSLVHSNTVTNIVDLIFIHY